MTTTHKTLAPGVGATFYGNLPADLRAHRDVIEACDLVTLHTAADTSDVQSADLVRGYGCQRVWLAIPANYLSRMDWERGRSKALAEAQRVARIARDMGAECLELNGEGASSGAVVGDWTSVPRDVVEAQRLESLGCELVGAIREVYDGAIGWTSHDGVRSFSIPRGLLLFIDLHSPQHYPAQPGVVVTQRTLERRVAWSQGQWEALAATGRAPVDVAPHGARWSPYGQAHGHTVGAMAWMMCEAATARLWACPNSWSPEAIEALKVARAIRSIAGYGPEAVEKFQALAGLEPDGIVGARTIAAALAT